MKKTLIFLLATLFIATLAWPRSITVKQPNGGEGLPTGTMYPIKWDAEGTINPFKVTLWKNGVLVGTIKSAVTAGNGIISFNWRVGSLENGVQAGLGQGFQVKVKEADVSISDLSDNTFSILTIQEQPFLLNMEMKSIQIPDLRISIIPNPESPGIYEKTKVMFRVDNIGSVDSKATKMRVFMGTHNTDTWDVPFLLPGRHYSLDKELIPDSVGYILWSADVDHDKKIGDNNRANNFAQFKMTLRGPDLKITNVRSPDRKQILLQKCVLDVEVTNIGSVPCGTFELDVDMHPCPGIAHGRDYRVHEGGLAPGQIAWFRFTHRYACYGNRMVDIHVDKNNQVKEENESNNEDGFSFHISGGNIID